MNLENLLPRLELYCLDHMDSPRRRLSKELEASNTGAVSSDSQIC